MMEVLAAGAAELGFALDSSHLAQFEHYYRELIAWNQRFNLTAVTDYVQVQRRHFWDSLTCMLAFPNRSGGAVPNQLPVQLPGGPLHCADVGSGAGFPGIPLAILMSDVQFTLIESIGKKVTFLEHIVRTLALDNVTVLGARAEELGHDPRHREHYDVVLARAVAALSALAEYCLPLCRVGGRMIAPKGADVEAEITEAAFAVEVLGGTIVCNKPITVDQEERRLVVIDKIAHTPERYPRNTGVPTKRPLRAPSPPPTE
ncbi:MAG: 16S rRNA (guanine(527)-N(7))-methyltransferase RsmG [Anaerolineales bacterium]